MDGLIIISGTTLPFFRAFLFFQALVSEAWVEMSVDDRTQLPRPQFTSSNTASNLSIPALAEKSNGADTPRTETSPFAPQTAAAGLTSKSSNSRRKWVLAGVLSVVLIVLVLVIVLPVYFLVVAPKNLSQAHGGGSTTSPPSASTTPKPNTPGQITGGDGSLITTEDGSTFVYKNNFGGYWYYDPADPFNDSARPQQDIPPLNQSWRWGVDVIQGVNLGGWLITEPFVTPALYQLYPGVEDEYQLSLKMRADTANGGIDQLEEHYKTFITERDFAEIAAAGLNWVRLPIPYWAIEVWPGEPFLEGVSWKYALKAFEWARKYGIRINLDLHSAPGSQNEWLHSGRGGHPNFLIGPMGYANGQRTLDYIRIITEFISQDQYKNVIPMFGILNEPTPPQAEVERFYYQAHQTVRSVTGLGAGHGPFISFHDGFGSLERWAGFLKGSDRVAIDRHPYFAFGGASSDPLSSFVTRPCSDWGPAINTSMTAFGITTAGEWSLGWNDCGLYVNGVNGGSSHPGGCAQWEAWEAWTPDIKENLRLFALNQMSALQNHFFWSWKIGPASDGHIRAPFWSYKLGVDNEWIPKNPRDSAGVCPSTDPFNPSSLLPWQIGGPGAGTITSSIAAYVDWPPATAQFLYAPNRPIPKLPPPSYPSAPNVDPGDGWTNDGDTALSMGPNPGCAYPNAWDEGGGSATAECHPAQRV